jgi:uncharacterized membrane protein YtjA (UPF0391 family)
MEIGTLPSYKEKESWSRSQKTGLKHKPESRLRETLNRKRKEVVMLRWALGFFIVAILAGLLGFSGIALASAGIAKILFFIFLVLFLVSLVGHLLRRT